MKKVVNYILVVTIMLLVLAACAPGTQMTYQEAVQSVNTQLPKTIILANRDMTSVYGYWTSPFNGATYAGSAVKQWGGWVFDWVQNESPQRVADIFYMRTMAGWRTVSFWALPSTVQAFTVGTVMQYLAPFIFVVPAVPLRPLLDPNCKGLNCPQTL